MEHLPAVGHTAAWAGLVVVGWFVIAFALGVVIGRHLREDDVIVPAPIVPAPVRPASSLADASRPGPVLNPPAVLAAP